MTAGENPFDGISLDAVKYTAFIRVSNALLNDAAMLRRWAEREERARVRRQRWSDRREYWEHVSDGRAGGW